ncbi:permease of the major facilitator superfamily protein [alpha proteobacterium BAL199]|nr:permease of the major facilitator superfamily protein [alpha proteobacterium BAL199]
MLSLSMGLRQSLGLFMAPLTLDLAISVADFAFAIAVQNLIWGLCQPFAGFLVTRWGFRTVMVAGAALYIAGLTVLTLASGLPAVLLGAGILIGVAMALASSSMALSVTAQVVSTARRSSAMGLVSAAGSLGALIAAPLGQVLISAFDWRAGMLGFAIIALALIPAAWFAGRVDSQPVAAPGLGSTDSLSARGALQFALRQTPFVIMTLSYFVCGMQLVFLTTHLPSYLALCGQDPLLGATALGVIGGFNVLGSLFFGWAGGRWHKQLLLGVIYIVRSAAIAWYFLAAPSPESTVVFAAVMGFLWLGVAPLVAGSVVDMFGLRWLPMLQGVTFMSHQFGSFVGAFGGGWLFDALGSYDLALQIGVGTGLAAGLLQIVVASLPRPTAALPA